MAAIAVVHMLAELGVTLDAQRMRALADAVRGDDVDDEPTMQMHAAAVVTH